MTTEEKAHCECTHCSNPGSSQGPCSWCELYEERDDARAEVARLRAWEVEAEAALAAVQERFGMYAIDAVHSGGLLAERRVIRVEIREVLRNNRQQEEK